MIKGDGRMNNPKEADTRGESSEHPALRQPYVKPTFSWEPVFETTALASLSSSDLLHKKH